MTKSKVHDVRFDFRGGRNTTVNPDLLNPNELVDATNVRLTEAYGAITKRYGSKRIHQTALGAAVKGVTQWDGPNGLQTVAIANGKLWWRDGHDFTQPFVSVEAGVGVARTTANQTTDPTYEGWYDPDGTDNGINVLTRTTTGTSTVAAGSRLYNIIGDPDQGSNVDAGNNEYTLTFKVTSDLSGVTGGCVNIANVTIEYSTDGGANWFATGGSYSASMSVGPGTTTVTYTPTVTVPGSPSTLRFRLVLTLFSQYTGGSGTAAANVQIFNTVYRTNNYPITWTTGVVGFDPVEPAFFMPFRASSAGAPLVLYIASGNHYYKWTGTILSQHDPTNNTPQTNNVISYHTRAFVTSPSYPKTIFWSEVGDAEDFTTGTKVQGGSAVTDFLTGQALVALEVLGSSLLMATEQSIMRFTGHTSDDIVISQNTEGISAEVGVISPQGLKRFENFAAALTNRGVYVVSETDVAPLSEQISTDFNALDEDSLPNGVIQYEHGDKQLLVAVPGASDSGLNKTVYAFATRLQAWQGPWVYPFGITSMCHYHDNNDEHFVLAGCSDGFLRQLGTGLKDDVLYDGSGGTNITMTAELPTLHFGIPGVVKGLGRMKLQAKLPSGHDLKVRTAADGGVLSDAAFIDNESDGVLRDYRVDIDEQGRRIRLVFTDASAVAPVVYGYTLEADDMQRP